MKITLIGGSQGTGAELASLARAAGHHVTVVTRGGTAPSADRIIAGDATDPAVAADAVTGADAVVVTVGGAKGVSNHRAAVTRAVIKAMQEAWTQRLIVQSSLGAGSSAAQLPGLLGLITKLLLAKPLADHNEQERAVFDSGLDWTVVRPTGLTDKEPTGNWKAYEKPEEGRLGGSVSRRDLAAYLLELLTEDSMVGRAVGISN